MERIETLNSVNNIGLPQWGVKNNDIGIEKENIYMNTLINKIKRDFKFLHRLAAFDEGWSFSGYGFFTKDGRSLY